MTEEDKRNPFKGPFPPSRRCKEDPEISRMIDDSKNWGTERNLIKIFSATAAFVFQMKLWIAWTIGHGDKCELDPFYTALEQLKTEAAKLCEHQEPV